MLSDLSPTNRVGEVNYGTVETDHEYAEISDNVNQPQYEDISLSTPKPKPEVQLKQLPSITGDYEFTQCPAYVPVATTSIHGSTTETPSTH